jgi:hypothetical protein
LRVSQSGSQRTSFELFLKRNYSARCEEFPILRYVWVRSTHTYLKIGALSIKPEQLPSNIN